MPNDNNLQWKIDAFNELERRAEELTQELRSLNTSLRWFQFWKIPERRRQADLKESLSCVRFVMYLVGRDLARQQETDE